MRSLYEKLNGLDDSLVESKRIVKKKKLTESVTKKSLKEDYNSEDAIELVAEMITGGDTGLAEELCDALTDWGVPVYAEASSWFAGSRKDYAKILAEHGISLPMSNSDVDNAAKIINTEYYNWTQSTEIKRQVAELKQNSQLGSAMDWYSDTGDADDAGWPNAALAGDPEFLNSALDWYLDSYYYDVDHDGDEEEDYDDDIDEMLTENTRNNKLQSVADQIIKYAEEHPESLRNFKYMYDYIDNLSQEGRFEIPAKVGQFVLQDPENVTEVEAEEFINMLLDETSISDRLIQIKEANRKDAWNKLRKQFPSL